MKKFIRFLKDKSGATAIEYGLIAALIAVAIASTLSTLGGNLETQFSNISNEIQRNNGGSGNGGGNNN